MFYSWSDNNKITTKALQIQYTGSYSGTHYGTPVYEFHRIATKEYEYVGMTEAAAKACQDAKGKQYTRTLTQWFNENGRYVGRRQFLCVADVAMNDDGDGLWTVTISVSEDQVQYYPSPDASAIPYDLFDLSLDYDESPITGGYLCISNVWRENGRLYISYQQGIEGFDKTSSDFKVFNSTDDGTTWTQITPTNINDQQMYFNNGAWQNGKVKLMWGEYMTSNIENTPTVEHTDTLDLLPPYWQVIGGTDGAWRVQYWQDFGNFDPANLIVQTKQNESDAWTDITANCQKTNTRIYTPFTTQEYFFWLRCIYNNVTSNSVSNITHFFTLDADNFVVNKENNQVTTVITPFTTTISNFDSSKVSIEYKDPGYSRIYSGSYVVVADDGAGNYTATIDVGNQILWSPMKVEVTLIYDGARVGTLTKNVYPD